MGGGPDPHEEQDGPPLLPGRRCSMRPAARNAVLTPVLLVL